MKAVGSNKSSNDFVDDERLSHVKQELKIQDNAIDMFISRQKELLNENDLLMQRQLTHSGMRLPPLERDEEEVYQ